MTEKPIGERVARLEEWVEGVDKDVEVLKTWKSVASQELNTLNLKVGIGQDVVIKLIGAVMAIMQGYMLYLLTKG